MKLLRGQQRADVTATGSTGRWVATASRVPPFLYVPWLPRGVRVPSGNMMTQWPFAMKRRPCSATRLHASARLLRSMWIMSMRAIAQPKNGMYSSSRLNT
jgi:hypothetical protein